MHKIVRDRAPAGQALRPLRSRLTWLLPLAIVALLVGAFWSGPALAHGGSWASGDWSSTTMNDQGDEDGSQDEDAGEDGDTDQGDEDANADSETGEDTDTDVGSGSDHAGRPANAGKPADVGNQSGHRSAGNSGTVKIRAGADETGSLTANQPQVCDFHVSAAHFAAGQQLVISIVGQGGPNAGPSTYESTVTTDTNGAARDPATGSISLADGMYKLTAETGSGAAKHKVFNVDCATAASGDASASAEADRSDSAKVESLSVAAARQPSGQARSIDQVATAAVSDQTAQGWLLVVLIGLALSPLAALPLVRRLNQR